MTEDFCQCPAHWYRHIRNETCTDDREHFAAKVPADTDPEDEGCSS